VQPFVYIMANKRNGTLYIGVTPNLPRRAHEHRTGAVKGFSSRYGCRLLVWCEPHESMLDAIAREKQIKAGRDQPNWPDRSRNPTWRDLYDDLV
jgi:predicted GIY-YIG superfamily endonuclease